MLAVAPLVRPPLETCAAKAQNTVAAISCRSATRLVARCTAPIWVRSPNLSTVAIRLTTTAANSSYSLCSCGSAMSPMKKPKFNVAARVTKNPKTTFSRFIRLPGGGFQSAPSDPNAGGFRARNRRRACFMAMKHARSGWRSAKTGPQRLLSRVRRVEVPQRREGGGRGLLDHEVAAVDRRARDVVGPASPHLQRVVPGRQRAAGAPQHLQRGGDPTAGRPVLLVQL